MSKQTRVSHPIYSLLPTEVEGFDSLAELALDMRWSWNHDTDNVWRQLDPELWAITHNPWVVLQTVSRDQIERVLADPAFRKNVDGLVQTKRQTMEEPAWFQQNHSQNWTAGGRKPTRLKWDGRWGTAWSMATIRLGTRSKQRPSTISSSGT